MAPNPSDLLTDLLRGVSRSFYLTLRVLPQPIRPQISLAYLLARAADTIADTTVIPVEQRLETLREFRNRISDLNAPFSLGPLAERQSLPAEKELLDRLDEIWLALLDLSPADQQQVQKVLQTITGGQELDVRRFACAKSERVVALATDEELEDYIYRVAGCVGEFWTAICRAHLFPTARLNESALLADSVRFGKGLQLVNVLRDLSGDLRQGRCYLPRDLLAQSGLEPEELLSIESMPKLRSLYDGYLDRAEMYLASGWNYTNTIPQRCARVRLACAWPVLIGLQTLRKLRSVNALNPRERVKVSRGSVWKIISGSVLLYPFPWGWNRLFPRVSSGKPVASPAYFE